MPKTPAKKRRGHKFLIVLGIIVLALIIFFAAFANILLPRNDTLRESADASGYHYEVTQTPASPVSGRKIAFTIHVTKDNKAVAIKLFTISTTHANGYFVREGEPDVFLTQVSNVNGTLTYVYTPKFWSIFGDSYSFGIAPGSSTSNEKQASDDALLEGVGFDLKIAPRWLGWFVWQSDAK